MWIADRDHSKRLDERAIEQYDIPVRVLMERAGLAVFEAIREIMPKGGRIGVICGKGNNGGDGFVVARHAKEHGYQVECLVAASPGDLTPEAEDQMRVARAQSIEPIFYGDPRWTAHADSLGAKDLLVDAVLGTGMKGIAMGPALEAIQAINRSGVPTVAVDIPSGIDCDTGEELGESVWAMRTVTFGQPKPFLFQGMGLEHSGYWTVADIGFPGALLHEATDARLIDDHWVCAFLPERLRGSHKGQNGTVLIVAGSRDMPGAATLAARAALRSGAGLVTVAGVEMVCRAVAAQVPEATLMLLPEAPCGAVSPQGAELLIKSQSRFTGALFGPGLTHNEPVLELLRAIWPEWHVPSVIDADALNSVSQGVSLPEDDCVLTPHPGEMSRMLERSIAEIQADRFRTVEAAVARFGKTVLLKGPYSIVGEPGQAMIVNRTGNPGMASGGMGDVLSGVIATLLSQDVPPYQAASSGMFWHGLAGDLCAQDVGAIGFTAIEVANALPKARATITSRCEHERP
ncbi:MAG: NAD(P)H-hydrate dehydratase [Armatimonadetes bacterium]|nr:NAD(P)H-hydrate dehydratase [Armatimonadota bacterium]